MSREDWRLIKLSKRFYVNTYRKTGSALLISLALNVCFGVVIHYLYFSQPEHTFFATDGVTPPIELTPMDSPNDTSVPLLGSDAVSTTNVIKVIPQ